MLKSLVSYFNPTPKQKLERLIRSNVDAMVFYTNLISNAQGQLDGVKNALIELKGLREICTQEIPTGAESNSQHQAPRQSSQALPPSQDDSGVTGV